MWQGKKENFKAAQEAFLVRARANGTVRHRDWRAGEGRGSGTEARLDFARHTEVGERKKKKWKLVTIPPSALFSFALPCLALPWLVARRRGERGPVQGRRGGRLGLAVPLRPELQVLSQRRRHRHRASPRPPLIVEPQGDCNVLLACPCFSCASVGGVVGCAVSIWAVIPRASDSECVCVKNNEDENLELGSEPASVLYRRAAPLLSSPSFVHVLSSPPPWCAIV